MTTAELVARLTAQAENAERLGRLAVEATILRDVLHDLAQLDGVPATRPTPDTFITLEETAARLLVLCCVAFMALPAHAQGIIDTLAGGNFDPVGELAVDIPLSTSRGVAADAAGNFYVSDGTTDRV